MAVPALGQVESSEFTSLLPPEDGWTVLNEFCGATQWIEDGWLVQDVDFCPEFPPPSGQVFGYTKSLAEWDGVETFWYETRMYTDGESTEFPGIGPANFSLWSNGSTNCNFKIARDVARLNRDNVLPIVLVDIEPDVPHTHRVELYGDELYIWYIDGVVVDSGRPQGAYPSFNPNTNMGERSVFDENMVWWDYIRWGGPIPEEGSMDFAADGDVDAEDFYYVHDCLTKDGPLLLGGPENDAGPGCRFADSDNDGDVDLKDIAAFQNAYTGEGE